MTLKFATFISDIDLSFYTSLASHKINHDKLDDSARRLLGLYEIRPLDSSDISCRLQIHGNALTNDIVPASFCRAEGMIKNVNTIEDYKQLDKGQILKQSARTIWDSIHDGTIFSCPSLLASFSVICFADIKKYKFTYQFAFPVLHSDSPWVLESELTSNLEPFSARTGSEGSVGHFSGLETTALVDCVQTWRYGVDARQHGFFLAKKRRGGLSDETKGDSESNGAAAESDPSSPTQDSLSNKMGFLWAISSLSDFESFFAGVAKEDQYICFVDPSTYPSYPGWMLRNLLVLMQKRWKLDRAQVLCYRDIQARRDEARSIILKLKTRPFSSVTPINSEILGKAQELPKVTGWERNAAGKVTSKVANLGEYMDPQRLADQAVDLNLKLIKWRIAPELDLETVKNTSCLLLGAGTLGSYVARNLMGWGVRKISFVDNGSVSFSNPVRQPLFNFKDCLAGGAKKAIRAAEALKEIYPGVNSKGHVISVPMAGHPIIDEVVAKSDFETLQTLIEEHDAIFLLMDTRESRWLPTVMGKAAGKVVMNAALGFDTFVVMRHGLHNHEDPTQELGCYFCNDVVAPADSVTDRTLDQQCTVTRPGIAAVASALVVEVFISILQHPQKALAPAPLSDKVDRGSHPLGLVPHQIRGFISNFQNILIKGKSYDCCSACCKKIIDAYKTERWQFVKRALNEKGYVEELSGLAEIQRIAEKAMCEIEWSEDESAGSDTEGEEV